MSAIVKSGETSGAGLALTGSINIGSIDEVFRLATVLAKADGFVPRAYIGKPEAISAVILRGIGLGIDPMEAMANLHLIDGKVAMDASYALARMHRFGIKTRWLTDSGDRTKAELEITRLDGSKHVSRFTWEDAQAAKLAHKDNWQKWPNQMLRRRATTMGARDACPEVFNGPVYTPDEITAQPGIETREDYEKARRDPAPIRVESSPAPRTSSGKRTLDDLAAEPITTDGEVIEARTADTHVAEVVAMIGNARSADELEQARGVARETAKRVGFSRSQNAEIKRAIDARAEALSAVARGEEVAS